MFNRTMEINEIQRNIRKNKDILNSSGYGILVFFAWNIVKIFVYVYGLGSFVSPGVEDESDILYRFIISTQSALQLFIGIFIAIFFMRNYHPNKKMDIIKKSLLMLFVLIALSFIAVDIFLLIISRSFDAVIIFSLIMDCVYATLVIYAVISFFKLVKLTKLEKEKLNER